MNDKSPDKTARVMAIISIVVALAAVVVPFSQQRAQFQALQREELSVALNPHVAEEVRLTETNLGSLGHVVQVPWELTISNTGNQQLSIIKYDLMRDDASKLKDYSGLDGGLATKELKPVNLPLTLEPGETKSFFLFVGITVPPTTYNTLKALNDGKSVQYKEATMALGERGVDLYGNKVEYEELEGDNYFLSVDTDNPKAQEFRCTISTGRGNTFAVSASRY